jgi:hypothetical protein
MTDPFPDLELSEDFRKGVNFALQVSDQELDRMRRLLALSEADFTRVADKLGKLQAAFERCLIGGNHLAVHIDLDGPDWRAEPDAGLAHYGAGPAYDAWMCWRAIMQAREMVP